jgi:hypothetical protein
MGSVKGDTSFSKAFRGLPTHGVNLDDALADCELRSIAAAKNAVGSFYDGRRECCSCPETRIGNKRYPLHRPQDCRYSVVRSSFVPEAEAKANRVVIRSADEGGVAAWMKVFCAEMEKLSRPLLNGALPAKVSDGILSNGGSAPPELSPEPESGTLVHCFSIPRGNPGDDLSKAATCFL